MRLKILPIMILILFIAVAVKFQDMLPGFVVEYETTASDNLSARAEDSKESEEEKARLGGFDDDAVWSPGPRKGPTVIDPSDVSEMEINILENLTRRRLELEKWSKAISMKENLLNATEKKVDRKMKELEKLKVEVAELLAQYNDRENKKINRLVKIYENMKAKDAARIFDKMDFEVLLEVIEKMKEAKAAPILAKMNSDIAKEVTSRLAKRRRLSQDE